MSMRDRNQVGFTLVELLLVLVIIGVVTAVTIPNVVRSIKGNRLRTAARTVVKAGRYARSMAVLRQRELKVAFKNGSEQRGASVTVREPGGAVEIRRILDRVSVDEIELQGDESASNGVWTVTYRSNGTCTPYTVYLRDVEGDRVIVSVDALSSAETERE